MIIISHVLPILIAASVWVTPQFALAQQQAAPPIQWQKCLGGITADTGTNRIAPEWGGACVCNCIRATSDGGYILAGITRTENNGDVTGYHDSLGTEYWDCWIVKIDQFGAIQWEHCFGGSGEDGAESVEQTSDGGYIFAGWTRSNDGDVTGHHAGNDADSGFYGYDNSNADYWVVKLDGSGNIQWENCYGSSKTDEANSIQQTSDGGYIVAGYSNSDGGDVTGHIINPGDIEIPEIWIVKLDDAGNIQWENCYGGNNGSDIGLGSIEQTSDGGYIVGGAQSTTAGGYWVFKLNAAGGFQWAKTYGDASWAGGITSIHQTNDGGYIACGSIIESGVDTMGYHSGFDSLSGSYGNPPSDYWVAKLDGAGNTQWARCYGGSQDDQPYEIQQMRDGGYIVAGYSNSFDGDVTGNHGKLDLHEGYDDSWILKIDALGNIQWEKCYGGSYADWAYSVIPTADGGCIFAGTTQSDDGDVTGNKNQFDPQGDQDQYNGNFWVVKLPPTASEISSALQSACQLLCGALLVDTVYIHDVGMKTLAINSAALSRLSSSYTILSPGIFPDSVAPGDSLACILQFSPSASGTYTDTLILTDNDTITGHSPWSIALNGIKNTIGFAVQNVKSDTLDFGALACGMTKDTTFFIRNTSTIPAAIPIQSGNPSLFSVAGYDTTASPIQITIHCSGGDSGTIIAPLFISDTCGITDTVYMKAALHGVSVVLSQADTAICGGDSLALAAPSGFASYRWSDGETSQNIIVQSSGAYSVSVTNANGCTGSSNTVTVAVVPNPAPVVTASGALSFCAGDSVILSAPGGFSSYLWSDGETTQTIIVKNNGTYNVLVTNANGCTGASAPVAASLTPPANITISSIASPLLCANETAAGYAAVRNLSIDTQSLVLLGSVNPLFSLSPDTLTLAPGDSAIVTITFHGSPDSGAYAAMYSYIDACGGAHSVAMSVIVAQMPPLVLTLQPDSSTMIVGNELKVYVFANPVSSISNGITFTAANEPTALHLDSVSTPCSAQITKNNDGATITLSACSGNINDTIATLYYQTLIGYTVTPYVRLQNVSTANTCDTVFGAGNSTITLSLPGCDLGQAVLTDYSTAINSVYPNPNTGIATVQYTTVEQANVTLNLCDELGRTVQTIVNAPLMPGTYTTEFSLNSIINGVYFLTMTEGKYYMAKEVWVLK